MANRILIGLVSVMTIVVVWNSWTVSSLSARIQAMEDGRTVESMASNGEAVSEHSVTNRAIRRSMKGKMGRTMKSETSDRGGLSVALDDVDASGDGAINLENPEVREAIEQIVADGEERRKETKRKEQLDMYLDSMNREVDTFANEYNLDAQTKAKLVRDLEARAYAWTAIKNDVQDGAMSWMDAREEFRALREEGEESMTALLGQEQYEDLRTRLWGNRGR